MQFYFEGEKSLEKFKNQADSFVCSVLPDSPSHHIHITPGFSLPPPICIFLFSLIIFFKYSEINLGILVVHDTFTQTF